MGEGIASKSLAAVLCVTAILNIFSSNIPRVFGLIPAHTFSVHSYPWNIMSYIFVETNIILCACSVGYLLTIGIMVENLVGTFTFLQIIVITSLTTSVMLLVISAILYQIGFSWFLQCYCGIWPVAAALLVPWIAAQPTASVIPRNLSLQLQRQQLPSVLLSFAFIIDILFRRRYKISEEDIDSENIFPGSVFTPALLGLCASWLFQRLFRVKTPLAFYVLFYPISTRFAAFFSIRLQKGDESNNNNKVNDAVAVPVLQSATNITLLPGSTAEEAERRRSIALAALNSRLQEAAPSRTEDTGRNGSLV